MKRSIPNWTYLPYFYKNKKEILAAVERVLQSGRLILGPEVETFEKNFAKFCGVRYAIGVGSGTDALFLSLKALGIGSGDEVITVPNTAVATVSAIVATGATPVFVDVNPQNVLIDPKKLEELLASSVKRKAFRNIKVIIPVHLYGQTCDMNAISGIAKKYDLKILEDTAQAAGVGFMGDIAAFSFYPTKIIGAFGDGGMVVTNNKKLADTVRLLRQYGWKKRYYAEFNGYNSRLDELQAAILSLQLNHIEKLIKERRAIAARYTEGLKDTPMVLPDPNKHVFHLYVVRYSKRDKFVQYLKNNKIDINIHYPTPIHRMPAYRYLGYKKGDFPVAEQACDEVFSLPLYPGLTRKDQNRVISTIKRFFR